MPLKTDELRTQALGPMPTPAELGNAHPITDDVAERIKNSRRQIEDILTGRDNRLLVIVGPCSVHDTDAALDYAERLSQIQEQYKDELFVVMRTYFEKPRTVVGWKGLINDPYLDDSYQLNDGLRIGRKLLLDLNELGLPTAGEFLDMITPQYTGDLMCWGAIGARTTESQVHRELASGLSCPVGFKNGTDGTIKVAIDAIGSASAPHHFLSVNKFGHSAIVETAGNGDCHIILRGGKTPNFDKENVDAVIAQLEKSNASTKVMVDFSHANSSKKFENQMKVCTDVSAQIASGNNNIFGVMVESHINEGRQDLVPGQPLTYGQSITDACIGWQDTETLLAELNDAVLARRAK